MQAADGFGAGQSTGSLGETSQDSKKGYSEKGYKCLDGHSLDYVIAVDAESL